MAESAGRWGFSLSSPTEQKSPFFYTPALPFKGRFMKAMELPTPPPRKLQKIYIVGSLFVKHFNLQFWAGRQNRTCLAF